MKLIECVPNFSEGADLSVIKAITATIEATDGVKLLDVDPGKDTNRTVVTFIGDPENVITAAFEAIKKASILIDMSKQTGEHPRMGATDVCPLIPVSNVSMNECVRYSHILAKKVGNELGIPIYLYELATLFHSYWNLGKDNISFRFIHENKPTSLAKLIILKCISRVVKSGLDLIGVNSPSKM